MSLSKDEVRNKLVEIVKTAPNISLSSTVQDLIDETVKSYQASQAGMDIVEGKLRSQQKVTWWMGGHFWCTA